MKPWKRQTTSTSAAAEPCPGDKAEGRLRRFIIRHPLRTVILVAAIVAIAAAAPQGPEHIARAVQMALSRLRDLFPRTDRPQVGDAYFRPTIRYPAALIDLFRQAKRDGRDILADFEALERAWKAANGDAPLTIHFVHPAIKEPSTGRAVSAIDSPPQLILAENFDELKPLLQDIYLLATNGDGKGAAPRSGILYAPDVQPASP